MLAEISVECTGSGHAQKLFASRFILVQCRVHTCPAVRGATDIPCYRSIKPPHFPFAFLAFSGFSVVPTCPPTGSFREH